MVNLLPLLWRLVALGPAQSFNNVPQGRLMALVTLADFGTRLAGDLGHHVETHLHIVARRRLVALDAVHGFGRRMPELRDRPLRRPVALGTVLAEERLVPILGGMAGHAIQDRLLRGEA